MGLLHRMQLYLLTTCVCIVLILLIQVFITDNTNELREELVAERKRGKELLVELGQLQERIRNAYGKRSSRVPRLPTIIAITPTYTRLEQKAELTRLSQTLLHVPNFHWIVVEDNEQRTGLVTRFLESCGLAYTHLNIITPPSMQLVSGQPRWKKHRGVEQRNLALRWLVEHQGKIVDDNGGVVYFMDDDNTYALQLFDEMRYTRQISVWPVGLSGGLRWEGPLCDNGKVTGFYAVWHTNRLFPMDMAGFAFNLQLLIDNPQAKIDPDVHFGYLESSFLESLKITRNDLEPRAANCRKVYVWHTRTEKPKMKQEDRLKKEGRQSDPSVET